MLAKFLGILLLGLETFAIVVRHSSSELAKLMMGSSLMISTTAAGSPQISFQVEFVLSEPSAARSYYATSFLRNWLPVF